MRKICVLLIFCIAVLMISVSAVLFFRGEKNFSALCEDGTAERIEDAVASGANIDERGDDGWTPLMIAASYNRRPEAIKAIVSAGADVNARDDGGWTPLMLAARHNANPEVIKTLVGLGADAGAANNSGRTVLMSAVSYDDNPGVFRILMNAGADVNARNADGETALMFAAYYGYIEEIKELVAGGADVNARSDDGWTPLALAAGYGDNPEAVIFLLETGAAASENSVAAAYDNERMRNSEAFRELTRAYERQRGTAAEPFYAQTGEKTNSSGIEEPPPLEKPLYLGSGGRTYITAYQEMADKKLRAFFTHKYGANEAVKALREAIDGNKLDEAAARGIGVNKFAYEYSADGTAYERLFDDYYDGEGKLIFSSDPGKRGRVAANKFSGQGLKKLLDATRRP
jgi:ankyrin repeat protein